MLTEHSTHWSALRTFELTREFTSARVEAVKVYHTSIPGKHVDGADKTIHRHHEKLASAVALVGASSPDATTFTPFSVEVSFLKGNDDRGGPAAVVLRLAQNKKI